MAIPLTPASAGALPSGYQLIQQSVAYDILSSTVFQETSRQLSTCGRAGCGKFRELTNVALRNGFKPPRKRHDRNDRLQFDDENLYCVGNNKFLLILYPSSFILYPSSFILYNIVMQFKQFFLGCLAHASYYIGSNDEAAIVDPQRDVEQYLDYAQPTIKK
jgi:hypothetical protein